MEGIAVNQYGQRMLQEITADTVTSGIRFGPNYQLIYFAGHPYTSGSLPLSRETARPSQVFLNDQGSGQTCFGCACGPCVGSYKDNYFNFTFISPLTFPTSGTCLGPPGNYSGVIFNTSTLTQTNYYGPVFGKVSYAGNITTDSRTLYLGTSSYYNNISIPSITDASGNPTPALTGVYYDNRSAFTDGCYVYSTPTSLALGTSAPIISGFSIVLDGPLGVGSPNIGYSCSMLANEEFIEGAKVVSGTLVILPQIKSKFPPSSGLPINISISDGTTNTPGGLLPWKGSYFVKDGNLHYTITWRDEYADQLTPYILFYGKITLPDDGCGCLVNGNMTNLASSIGGLTNVYHPYWSNAGAASGMVGSGINYFTVATGGTIRVTNGSGTAFKTMCSSDNKCEFCCDTPSGFNTTLNVPIVHNSIPALYIPLQSGTIPLSPGIVDFAGSTFARSSFVASNQSMLFQQGYSFITRTDQNDNTYGMLANSVLLTDGLPVSGLSVTGTYKLTQTTTSGACKWSYTENPSRTVSVYRNPSVSGGHFTTPVSGIFTISMEKMPNNWFQYLVEFSSNEFTAHIFKAALPTLNKSCGQFSTTRYTSSGTVQNIGNYVQLISNMNSSLYFHRQDGQQEIFIPDPSVVYNKYALDPLTSQISNFASLPKILSAFAIIGVC